MTNLEQANKIGQQFSEMVVMLWTFVPSIIEQTAQLEVNEEGPLSAELRRYLADFARLKLDVADVAACELMRFVKIGEREAQRMLDQERGEQADQEAVSSE